METIVSKQPPVSFDKNSLTDFYKEVRNKTLEIVDPLETEDFVPQPILDVSPPRWHLGHTTWFFETFILEQFKAGYSPFNPSYSYVFNSYYHHVGERWERQKRGSLSRPTVKEIIEYRKSIDEQVLDFLSNLDDQVFEDVKQLLLLGLNHEQQHQELMVYDIKFILASNPLRPVYSQKDLSSPADKILPAVHFIPFDEGIFDIGHSGTDFYFDNEKPTHKVFLQPFSIRNSLVTNREYMQFMEDGGYSNFRYWLAEGWDLVQQEGWRSPLYWIQLDGEWHEVTLHGVQKVNPDAAVTHISYFEAEAYATWVGKRLPTEFEWETAAKWLSNDYFHGHFSEKGIYHPLPVNEPEKHPIYQMFGTAWEWTGSAYLSYPGYRQAEGAIGEYNGKFMVNQMILRGGSCATPENHFRLSYRNFFHADKRWLFSAIRLADDIN